MKSTKHEFDWAKTVNRIIQEGLVKKKNYSKMELIFTFVFVKETKSNKSNQISGNTYQDL